ncbi:MAG: hypothetical protein ACE5HU_09730 [Acidobacteriota bacterium]
MLLRAVISAGIVVLGLLPACDGNGAGRNTGGSTLSISMSFTPPPAGSMNVVWLSEASRNGGLLLMDVFAQNISIPFDGYEIELRFDPLVAEALDLVAGTLPEQCSGLTTLRVDNVASGDANASGTILFSARLTGPQPPGCTVVERQPLARITFRASGTGSFPLSFVPFNGDPIFPGGSRLLRTDPPDPAIPVMFDDSQAVIDVAG